MRKKKINKAIDYLKVMILIFMFNGIVSTLVAQSNSDDEKLIALIDTLNYSIYQVGVSSENETAIMGPGSYVKSNLSCEQRNQLKKITFSSFIRVLSRDLILGRKISILLYDITRTEATVFVFIERNSNWTEAFWKTQIDQWSQKQELIELSKSSPNCW